MAQMVFTQEGHLSDRTKTSIERIQMFVPRDKPYYLAFSGGKDSIVIKDLCEKAGVSFETHHNLTGIDPPDLYRYMKKEHTDVIYHRPGEAYFQLIKINGLPSRWTRWCCSVFKEGGGNGRTVITGVRWSESNARSKRQEIEFDRYGSQSKDAIKNRLTFENEGDDEKRRMIEACQTKGKHILNPIIDWTDKDVWAYIKKNELPYCELYDCGFDRIGCVGCPLASPKNRLKAFERYPQFERAYIRSIDHILNHYLPEHGWKHDYVDAKDCFDDWVQNGMSSRLTKCRGA